MHCRQCGAPVYLGQANCLHCGAPLRIERSSPELAHPAHGIPTEPFEPSVFGPPLATEVPPGALDDSPPVRRVAGYHPVDLPPPPASRSAWRGCVRVILVALLVVACVILVLSLWPRLPVHHVPLPRFGDIAFAWCAAC